MILTISPLVNSRQFTPCADSHLSLLDQLVTCVVNKQTLHITI
jgi:hypothetical protein